jgi:DNA-binding Lrp family transcriptional regulator
LGDLSGYFVETTKVLAEMKLSASDQALLALLREDARASTAHIARRLGLSRTTVQSRIERLEREGVIAGYTVRVSDEYERRQVRAHIMIAVHPKQMTTVVEALRAMPELRALHSVSGSYDLVAVGAVPAVDAMDALTDRIGALEGVERTTSSIVLSTKFER